MLCKQGKDAVFSKENGNGPVVVQSIAKFEFEDKYISDRLMPVHLQACHTELNDNSINIKNEVMEASLPSLLNCPILAFIYKDENGDFQFHTHDMHKDEDGNEVYDESVIGVLPESSNPHIQYDDDKKRDYVEVDGYLFKDYTKAPDILQREKECSVSVEMFLNKFSFDNTTKILDVQDFYFTGVTILGKWADGTPVEPGMAGANITISDFSKDNNSLFALFDRFESLESKIEDLTFQIKNSTKGGKGGQMDKFKELLAKYGKTEADITFEYEGLSDEELTDAFSKAFDVEPGSEPFKPTFTIQLENGDENKQTFALNMSDKIRALSKLVNAMYGSYDIWYMVDVFEGDAESDNYVIMNDYNGNIYKQNYSVNEDGTYALTGNRVAVKAMYLTEEEITSVEEARKNYPGLVEKLQKIEDEPKKMELLNSKDYEQLGDNTDFIALKEQSAHFDLSIDDLKAKADSILLMAAKAGTLMSKASESSQTSSKRFVPTPTKKSGRYGRIFSKE
jgi:hypothetical protein